MSQPTPDYREYNLEQLHDLLGEVDKARFPERFEAIRRQIELQGGDPDTPLPPPFWVPEAQITTTLKVVRWLVGFEYGFALLMPIIGWAAEMIANDTLLAIGLAALPIAVVICAVGVGIMHNALDSIRNRTAVEIGWLSALGLAPFCTGFYMAMAIYFADLGQETGLLVCLLLTPAAFCAPFVFLTMWIKYRYRNDEF